MKPHELLKCQCKADGRTAQAIFRLRVLRHLEIPALGGAVVSSFTIRKAFSAEIRPLSLVYRECPIIKYMRHQSK